MWGMGPLAPSSCLARGASLRAGSHLAVAPRERKSPPPSLPGSLRARETPAHGSRAARPMRQTATSTPSDGNVGDGRGGGGLRLLPPKGVPRTKNVYLRFSWNGFSGVWLLFQEKARPLRIGELAGMYHRWQKLGELPLAQRRQRGRTRISATPVVYHGALGAM